MVISRITGLPDDEGRALHDRRLHHTTRAPTSPCDSTRHRRLLYRATVH
ncbi:hypothetical protein ACIP88_33865 [Streptomyces uncialis]